MKKLIYALLLFVLTGSAASAQKTIAPKVSVKNAETKIAEREKFDPTRIAADDLKNAVTQATKENKRIVLDIGGEWCGWCRLMDNYLIKNAELGRRRDENFVWVKINMSPENENKEFLAAYPEITGYPHLFVLDKNGKLLHSQETAALEEGKGYNLHKFTEFLTQWSPTKASVK